MVRLALCTLEDKRDFGAIDLNEIFKWVDASYAIHHGMQSQTGGAMYMGLGFTKFRSNNRS